MKQHIYLFIAGMIALASCAKQLPATVEYPMFSYANTQTIRITKVERTDTATVVSVHAEFIPHYWIRIASGAHLVADGDCYALTGGDGIVPDELLWMPDSGEADFSLFFEPLGPGVKKVDFIEGDSPRDFCIYDIDLGASGAEPKVKMPKKIGKPSLTSGQTTITVDMSFNKRLVGEKVTLYVNTSFPLGSNEYSSNVGEDGMARFSFWQNGPARIFLSVSNFDNLVVNPGENVTVHPEGAQWKWGDSFGHIRVDGAKFADLRHPAALRDYVMDARNGNFAKEGATGKEYVESLVALYNLRRQSLEESALPSYDKEYIGLFLKGEVCAAVNEAPLILRYKYSATHNGSVDGYRPISFSDEDYFPLKNLGLDDTRILLVNNGTMLTGRAAAVVFGEQDNFSTEYAKAEPLMKRVLSGKGLGEDDKALMESFTYPLFRDGIEHMQKEMEEAAATMPESVRIAPDVPDAEVLDTILAQYAGKTVMVDIWATWCGPCRRAHEELEPLKDTDYSDVQFVYLTSPTSPRAKWVEMIRGIRGDHYYLTEDQLNTIFAQLESNAYPTYLIVGKDGSRKGRFMGYDADAIRKAIESAR